MLWTTGVEAGTRHSLDEKDPSHAPGVTAGLSASIFLSPLEDGAMGVEVSRFPRENELTQVPRGGISYIKIWVADIKMNLSVGVFLCSGVNPPKLDGGR